MYKLTTLLFFVCLLTNGLFAQNQNLSNGSVFEGEPFIAINPTNSQNIVVAWMGFVPFSGFRLSIKIKSSMDGGATWSAASNMPHMVSTYKSADPSMVFDQQGNLFLSYIDYRENPDSGGVYLFKSTNGGVTWGNPVLIIDAYADGAKRPIDRPWLTCNAAGTRLFLTTKPAPWVLAPNRPYVTASFDGGQTWQSWRYIDTANYLVGNVIAEPMAAPVFSGNTFYAVYPSYVPAQNLYPQFILASTTTASTFIYHTIQMGTSAPANDTAKLGYHLIADPVNSNHLAFVFPLSPNGDLDVMLTETFDAGANWSTAVRVNDDAIANGKMQDLIWADFDNDGDLMVSWRDRRNAPGNYYQTSSEFYAAFRAKDSTHFAANFKISDSLVAFNSVLLQNGNDFMGIELTNDTLSAVWSNTRDGSLDVWFIRSLAQTGKTLSIQLLESNATKLSVFPNPTSGNFQIAFEDHSSIQSVEVYNSVGQCIQKIVPKSDLASVTLTNAASGTYFIKVKSTTQQSIKTIVKQ